MRIIALRRKEAKGRPVETVGEFNLVRGYGIVGDVHAEQTARQVCLLSAESAASRSTGGLCAPKFFPNIEFTGMEGPLPSPGTLLGVGEAVVEIVSIGKECYPECAVFRSFGPCALGRDCFFARVVEGGTVRIGDPIDSILSLA